MPKTAIIALTSKPREPLQPPQPAPQRFLSLRDVLDRLTISRSLLYELIKDPVRPFPAPVHIGRRSVWVEGEVSAYMSLIVENSR
jgi:predicted DNA-binding transcriptional regulator AlpA